MPILSAPKIDTLVGTSDSIGSSRRSLKVAYLVSQYPAISHTFIFNEISQLKKEGFEISTASINACDRLPAQLPELERAEQVATFYVKPAGVFKAVQSVILSMIRQPAGTLRGLLFTIGLGGTNTRFYYLIEAMMIGTWMKKQGLGHLHVHFGMAAATVGMIAARTFPITYSLTIHGPDEFYDVSKFYLTEKVEAARFVCCIGSFARSQLMKISTSEQWKKFIVAPLGVDPVKFTRPPREAKVPFEILCIGRLVPAKGQHILVSAVKRLIEENRPVRLRLLGDGPDRRSLEERVAKEGLAGHVILEGAVNQDRIPGFLKNADVFALASFAEGIPVALMEAMAMEIPVVSTMIAGIPELIRNEKDGLLVSPSDEDALAAALRRLMDDPEESRRLGRAGRVRVMDRYDLEKNVKALAEVFHCHLR